MKNPLIAVALIFNILFVTGCGGGSSSSGGAEANVPAQGLPASFVGVYQGVLNLTAEALGIKQSDSFAITITVFENGTVRFDGDDPDETFTVGISDSGEFSGNVTINEDECNGTIGVTGQVDGTTAAGTVQGNGECELSGNKFAVELTGDFSAAK